MKGPPDGQMSKIRKDLQELQIKAPLHPSIATDHYQVDQMKNERSTNMCGHEQSIKRDLIPFLRELPKGFSEDRSREPGCKGHRRRRGTVRARVYQRKIKVPDDSLGHQRGK
jgi:hypothetical protein